MDPHNLDQWLAAETVNRSRFAATNGQVLEEIRMTREGDIGGNYGIRTERQLEALWALETSIASVADLFKDDNAFNYSQEVEIASYLMVLMRAAFGESERVRSSSVHLSRMEWRCLPGRSIDLVVIDPGSAQSARDGWGTGRRRVAKTLPLLAAVEIKRGSGNVTPLGHVRKDLRGLNQIQASVDLGRPVTYFLAWIDSVLRQRPRQSGRYVAIKSELKDWCDDSPEDRRAFLLSRDRVGFAFPRGAWLVQPLPPGTIETTPLGS